MAKKHKWNVSEAEAISIQNAVAREVEASDRLGHIQYIAGVDISSNADSNRIWCTAIEFQIVKDKSFSETFKNMVDHSNVMMETKFEYTPGLLAFREGPPAILALSYLAHVPDLIIFDAHGVSHPRSCGLASHLCVYVDIPSIGCAKSILYGTPTSELENTAGSTVDIVEAGTTIAKAVRTKVDEEPVYVSVGHRVALDHAVEIILWLTYNGRFRIPVTTKWAHAMSNEFRKNTH